MSLLVILPTQDILHVSIQNKRMEFPEQALHLFHFSIVKVSWKQRIQTTHLSTFLPSIKHPLILVDSQSEQIRENIFQSLVLTPQILPKFDLPPILYDKVGSRTNTFPIFSNSFPHSHTIGSPHFSRTPTISFTSNFSIMTCFHKESFFYSKFLAPLPKQSFV